jgi:prophage DNA circulation protein
MDLFDATLDGYSLEIETLDDQFEKAIARYDIPYRDGAILEDMGQKARTLRIRCYFWDDGADHYTYADHIDLVNHLQSKELFELVHPKYGPMHGCVEFFSVRHDDRIMAAEVDIAFVEDLRTQLADVSYDLVDPENAAESAYAESQQQLMAIVADDAAIATGADAAAILNLDIDPEKTLLEQYTAIAMPSRRWVARIDALVGALDATLAAVANPANGITATINFGTKLPGRVIGSISRCIERYVVMLDTADVAPHRFLDSLNTATQELETRLGNSSLIRGAAAAHAAVCLGGYLKTDEQRRQQLRRSEQTRSFDMQGRYVAPPYIDPVMTVDQLEMSLATLNAMIQAAIDADRSQESLKQLARQQLEYINTIKLEREKIRQVTVINSQPLHLVCMANGLPYTYATRIQSINQIPQPNFTQGEISIYGR